MNPCVVCGENTRKMVKSKLGKLPICKDCIVHKAEDF